MEKRDDDKPGLRKFAPFLAPKERDQLRGLLNFAGPTPPGFADSLRSLARSFIDDGDSTKLRAVCLLIADPVDLGDPVDACEPGPREHHVVAVRP